jgi:hypothetical protein
VGYYLSFTRFYFFFKVAHKESKAGVRFIDGGTDLEAAFAK